MSSSRASAPARGRRTAPGPGCAAPEPEVRVQQAPATAGQVFALIRDGVAPTRREVGRRTGLSRTAVTARVSALVAHGFLVEVSEGTSTGGRPPARLALDAGGGVVLAAAIGRSRTQLGVCDLAGEVLASSETDQEVGLGPAELMPRVSAGLDGLLRAVDRRPEDVRGIGLSIPGTVDQQTGSSLDSPVMPGWDGVALAPFFATARRAPVLADNDANVMALSERRGHLETLRDLVMVKASTGLGAGIVAGGSLQRGALGAAGEIGHSKVAEAGGAACRCGDRGCVEAVAGGWALVQALREQGREVGHVRDVVALALAGDGDARRMIRESGRTLGEVLAGVVNVLNPAALVVGGDIAAAYDVLAAGLRESVYGHATALSTRSLQIVPATHGDRAGVVGCAAMVLDHVLSAGSVDHVLAGGSLASAPAG
jgi:predicted NBD/HSP70 family sugar kinase